MPYLNSKGEWCAGVGGAGLSWGSPSGSHTLTVGNSGSANWLDDDHVVGQDCSGGACVLRSFDVRAGTSAVLDPKGANTLYAGGGTWAAWLGGDGIRSSTGYTSLVGGLADVGPDGAICVKRDYQGAGPFDVFEVDGSQWLLTNGLANDPQLLGNRKAVWVEDGPKTIGAPTPNPMTRPFWWLRMLYTPDPDGWWCIYQDSTGRLLLHPVTSNKGYVLTGAGSLTYNPDLVRLSATTIRVAWSVTQGEEPQNIVTRDIQIQVDTRTELGTATPPTWDPSQDAGAGGPSGTTGISVGTVTLRSEGTFDVVGAAEELVTLPIEVWPAFPVESGHGRIIHPILGAFDYEVKPDEWVNIDADAIIAPVWSSTRTLTSASNVLWQGNLRDVTIEERWKALGGLSMPITQLRMLLAIWTTPVDPDVGYVQWFPNYITNVGFKVLPVMLAAGGQGVTFDDIVNYKDEDGEPIGWMTNPVTFTLKLVGRL